MAFLVTIHLLAAVLWVGGMFFSLAILRPVCIRDLDPPYRLKLMTGVMDRFFTMVWVLVTALLATGFTMAAGMPNKPWHVILMLIAGTAMAVIFLYAFFIPFQKAKSAFSAGNGPEAGKNFESIRKLVVANLSLGVLLVLAGGLGRYLQ